MDTNCYSATIYAEDQIGLLMKIANIFTRRHLNISGIYATAQHIGNVHAITVVADGPEAELIQAKMQLEKLLEVIHVYIDKGNVIENLPPSPSASHQRNSEVQQFIGENYGKD